MLLADSKDDKHESTHSPPASSELRISLLYEIELKKAGHETLVLSALEHAELTASDGKGINVLFKSWASACGVARPKPVSQKVSLYAMLKNLMKDKT